MAGKKKSESNVKSDNWGGKRPGAGRPTKEAMINIKQILDDTISTEDVMGKLAELIQNGDYRAIDLFLKYRVGTPTQSIDLNTTGNVDIGFTLNNIVTFEDEEDEGQDKD